MKHFITTVSNTQVDFVNPLPSQLLLSDIFHSLARLPRFVSHTRRRYSVGQHSLIVASLMQPNVALLGILHDAAEYVFNDVASPIVAMCLDYKRLRNDFQHEIYRKYLPDCIWARMDELEVILKTMDTNLCATEQKKLKLQEPTAGTVIPDIYFPELRSHECELQLYKMYHYYLEKANA